MLQNRCAQTPFLACFLTVLSRNETQKRVVILTGGGLVGFHCTTLKPRENGRNILGQQLPALLDATCCVRLHTLLHVVVCCCVFFGVVAQSLKLVNLLSQQLPTFLLFRDRRSVAQQCRIRLHSSSNIFGATHAQYTWSAKSYGLYPPHDALQVPTLLGCCCSRLRKTTNTDATTPNIVGATL